MQPDNVVYRSRINGQSAEVFLVDPGVRIYRLTVDGVPQSQVCLSDPARIDFDYVRQIARLIDAQADPGIPLACVHLGGGALTLARYVSVTRPGSRQYVVESEVERTTDLLGILPLPDGSDVRFLFGDARAIVDGAHGAAGSDAALRSAAAGNDVKGASPWQGVDVTIVDLWAGSTIVSRVASLEFYARLARLGAPDGLLVVNLIDGPGFRYARRQAAGLSTLFDHVAVAMDRPMFEQELIGNVLVVASNRPLVALAEPGWPAGDTTPPAVLIGDALETWIAGALPLTDADATDSPSPDYESFEETRSDRTPVSSRPSEAGDHVGGSRR